MTKEKRYLGTGLIIGAVISALFLLYFAPRYTTIKSGDALIRQDKWSGNSWQLVDNKWKRVEGEIRDWKTIDRTLEEALNLPSGKIDQTSALSRLREKHPVLKDISDAEMLERIKIVYSKAILCDLYLSNFLRLETGASKENR